jgi:hypothetical protein
MSVEFQFSEKLNGIFCKSNFEQEIESLCYQTRMLWIGRWDKINRNEFEFHLWLTNSFVDVHDINMNDIVINENLFINENHKSLSDQLKSNLIELRNSKFRPKNQSLWSKLKQLFKHDKNKL